MKQQRFQTITISFIVVIVLLVTLLMANSLRRSSHITLPSASAQAAGSMDDSQSGGDAVSKVEVTPQTVQAAVATLARPGAYVRLITVERLWSGGSGTNRITATVLGSRSRSDTVLPDGRVRHVIHDGETSYVWYDEENTVFIGGTAGISADQEQSIPTYEDVLLLDPSQIAVADYRVFSQSSCIYVETEPEEECVQRFWVSVDSGLLIGAEWLQDGETVYRMAAQPVAEVLPTAADFTLPDGTVLTDAG